MSRLTTQPVYEGFRPFANEEAEVVAPVFVRQPRIPLGKGV